MTRLEFNSPASYATPIPRVTPGRRVERFQPRIGAAVIVSDRKIAKPSDLKARNASNGETMCVFGICWKTVYSYGPLPVIGTYNPIYRMYNPTYNQL